MGHIETEYEHCPECGHVIQYTRGFAIEAGSGDIEHECRVWV